MRGRALCLGACALLAAIAAGAPVAGATAGPLYAVKATWGDTVLPPGGEGQFAIQVRNFGDAAGAADGAPLTITDRLPARVTITAIHWPNGPEYSQSPEGELEGLCSGEGTETVSCTLPADKLATRARAPGGGWNFLAAIPTGFLSRIYVEVAIDPEAPGASGEGTNTATVEGGGAPGPVSDVDRVPIGETPSSFGFAPGSFVADVFEAAYPSPATSRLASDHPFELRVNFDIAARYGVNGEKGVNGGSPERDGTTYITSNGQARTVEVTLPRGMIGNPEALPKCDPATFAEIGTISVSTACPANTQVGYLNVSLNDGTSNHGTGFLGHNIVQRVPIYNLVPPKGTPSDLGINVAGLVQAHIYAVLDPAQDYAIKTVTPNITSGLTLRGSEVTVWGVPADPAHDRFRYPPEPFKRDPVLGVPFAGASIRPFLTNPMDCGFENGGARARIDSYNHPGQFSQVQEYGKPPNPGSPLDVTGCKDPRFLSAFEPEIAIQPTDRHAGAPTGLDVHLKVPQQNDTVQKAEEANKLYAANKYVEAIATPPIKKVVVTFPPGMTLSPSAAQGLGSCSAAQIGLGADSPVTCPDNSQYGTLVLHTPLLPVNAQPEGFIYIAKQGENPFHNFLALYLVIQEPERGILVKIPAKLDLDPKTGRITSTFDNLPQFPVSDMQMTVKGGVRAGLVNPSTCGQKTIRAEFYSWHDPATPHPVDSSYQMTQKPDGSPCVNSLAERPFKPQIVAGTLNPAAGSYSPLLFRLTRTDDDQEFSQLGVSLPQGLTAKLAGTGRCPEAGIAQAIARTGAGEGALEQSSPSCPASALIGSTQVGVGVGAALTYVPGRVYLAGPYRGAPLSMVVITPAVVGPYDLGVIAVRSALHVDPETTLVSVRTDPLPLIYQGIPVRIRDIRVKTDRPNFTINPTSCKEKTIAAHLTGTGGDLYSTADDTAADLAQRFQAADCASLAFRPRLSFRLHGGTRRGAHPKLQAILRARPGDANIARAAVTLPRSQFLDQGHIRTVCTRAQFAVDQCPAGSVYGHAEATTPLLDQPLRGPVYLRSSSHPLPDLVVALKGQVDVNVIGRVDSVNGGIRNTFELVPDAPLTRFSLSMQGGKKGLLVNSTNLCAKANRALARFGAHNGRALTLRPRLQNGCAKRAGRGRGQRRSKR